MNTVIHISQTMRFNHTMIFFKLTEQFIQTILNFALSRKSNTYHRTIKMEPVDAKDNTCIDFVKDVNDKDPKFKVGDRSRKNF